MVECFDNTDASVVSPLNCEGHPPFTIIHFAEGEAGVKNVVVDGVKERHIIDTIRRQGRKVQDVKDQLQRCESTCAEFHCMMVKMEMFDEIGPFDEKLLNTK